MAISQEAHRALADDLVIDITTTGRTSGQPRTLEIWFHRIEDRYYITGWPGARGWYANLLADPRFTVTFKQTAHGSIAATARAVTDDAERRHVIGAVFEVEGGAARGDFESWVATSPVIEFIPVG
jgi:deazaflavin-dependent oxidoreductase (nitroreductase family)